MKPIENSVETNIDEAQLMLFNRYVKFIAASILAISLFVFINWLLNADILKTINPDWKLMKLQSAFGFVFSALSLYLLTFKDKLQGVYKHLFYISNLVIISESLLVILEYVTGVELLIELNGRMALMTAINFLFCSLSLLTTIKLPRFALNLIVIPLIIADIVFLNYLFGETAYLNNPLFSMALPTAFCFVIFSIGFLLLNLEDSFLWFIIDKTASAAICQRVLLLLFVLIPFIGWLRLQGQLAGWYGLGFGLSLYTIGMVLLSSYFIIWTAKRLREIELKTQLAEKEKDFLLKIIEEAHDYIGMANLNGNLYYLNSAAKRMLGFSEDADLSHLTKKDIYSDKEYKKLQEEIIPAVIKQGFWKGETALLHRDGHEIPVSLIEICHYDKQGKPIRFSAIKRDITEENKLRALMAETEHNALAHAQIKADFLANMSHEIRTPLNAILGLAFVLEKSQLSEDDKSLVHKIQGAGKSLLGIINHVLDISKIEAGKFELEIATFNLHDILDNLATIMTFNADEKNIELIIHPPTCYYVHHIKGDAPRLQQVLVNLVSNAIKFTHQGQVIVSITEQNINKQQVYLNFSVSDTGEGISKAAQNTIFIPFSQADNSITRRYGGTGLGLSISRQLVKLMGGDITLSSELGKGSCFSFGLTFDIDVDSVVDIDIKNPNIEVIIADDNEVARHALLSISKILGLPAVAVNSGQAVLDYVLKRNEDVTKQEIIILDWKMPDIDGLQTAKILYENIATANKKPIVIMVTAYEKKLLNQHPEVIQIFDAVLSKPVTASSLYDAITKALHKHQKTEPKKLFSNALPLIKPLKDIRLLVVDDNEINLEVASRIFKAEGALVIAVDNGQKALDYLKNNLNGIDLVLMDIQMPIMDGYEATRLIRQIPQLINLPIVALSAGVFKAQIEKAKLLGINDFIAKPFDIDAAVNLIAKLTNKTLSEKINQENPLMASDIQFSGIDIKTALEVWRDVEIYKKYLVKFSQDCQLLKMINNTSSEEFAVLIHKIKGTAKMLGLIEINTIAHEIDELIHAHQDINKHLSGLKIAIDAAQQFIDNYASPKQTLALTIKDFDAKIIEKLLNVVFQAVEQDSPDGLSTTLNELSTYLTAEHIEPIKLALDSFDFPLVKSEIIKLANQLKIPI